MLDEEIARLAETYRSVFVLCCLEELSQAEAGRRLGRLEQLKTSRFTVTAINPHLPQWVFFFHKQKQLGAALRLNGSEPKDFTVRLQPCATITGRIVDGEGRPRAGLRFYGCVGPFQHGPTHGGFFGARTDKEGRFRITGLIPRLKWHTVDIAEGSMTIGYLLRDVTLSVRRSQRFGRCPGEAIAEERRGQRVCIFYLGDFRRRCGGVAPKSHRTLCRR